MHICIVVPGVMIDMCTYILIHVYIFAIKVYIDICVYLYMVRRELHMYHNCARVIDSEAYTFSRATLQDENRSLISARNTRVCCYLTHTS